MSPRTGSGGLLVLVSVLVVLGGASPAGADLSPVPAGLSLQDRSPAPTSTPQPQGQDHDHEHEEPSPTPSGGHEHEPEAPTDGHGDHGTPPDTVSTTTRTWVIGGFGVLNAGVLAAAALVRGRQRRTRANAPPGTRR